MNSTTTWLADAIADLAAIHDDGNLADLQFAFAAECREHGGLPHPDERARQNRTRYARDVAKARDVARVASHLFGLPQDECERIALGVLVGDTWTATALDLIADYRGRTAPATTDAKPAKPARRQRAW